MKVFQTLKEDLIKNIPYILIGFFSLILVDILQLIIPRILKKAVDTLTGGVFQESTLTRYSLIIIAAGLLIAIARFVWRFFIIGTSRRIEKSLRDRLFSHVIKIPLKELIKIKTGDLMARMTNDLEAVRMCAGIGLVALFDTAFLGIAAIAFMLYISPTLTFVSLAPMLFIIFATWRLSGLLHRRFARVQSAFSSLTEKVRETIAGISVIKAYVREHESLQGYTHISRDYIKKNLSLAKIWGLFFPIIIFFSNLSIGLLILVGGRFTIETRITAGDFVAFASYLWILTWPMMALGWVVNIFQRGSASMARINELLNIEPEIIDYHSAKNAIPELNYRPLSGTLDFAMNGCETKARIEIRDLTFSYSYGSAPVLINISLSMEPGETIGITGKTGSGKTTLCNLMLRLFAPPIGTIFIDNIDICCMPLQELRTKIAYVPQDSFLFSDTIHKNISFGKPGASEDEIIEYAKRVQIFNEIMDFNDDFKTVTGEKGVTLSGGQKQRMCIARALLLNAPVLILDDSMSSLDVVTTQKIAEEIKTAGNNRTCIIVSNRIASILHADKILVFSEGRIVEAGKHQELMRKDGLYKSLFLKQQLENEA
jgi:ATP-binding cassette subfamily B protein